jgi:hypothetical protein
MIYAITSTRTNTRKGYRKVPWFADGGHGTISRQLPTFHVEAASYSEARVKALSILLDEATSTTVKLDVGDSLLSIGRK